MWKISRFVSNFVPKKFQLDVIKGCFGRLRGAKFPAGANSGHFLTQTHNPGVRLWWTNHLPLVSCSYTLGMHGKLLCASWQGVKPPHAAGVRRGGAGQHRYSHRGVTGRRVLRHTAKEGGPLRAGPHGQHGGRGPPPPPPARREIAASGPGGWVGPGPGRDGAGLATPRGALARATRGRA